MKVRMNVKLSGSRDGIDWPDPGDTIDLPADEAEQLISLDLASNLDDDDTPAAPAGRKGSRRAVADPAS